MKERESQESKLWLCMNLIMDQAMMENYKFVWYVHGTNLNHIFAIKKKY